MSFDNIESQIRRLLKQNYSPWSKDNDNEAVRAINDPIIFEIANWIFSILRQTITNVDSGIVEGMAEDIFYEFFASDKWLGDYNLVKIYETLNALG
jgi:hypothetical protein